MSAPATAVRAGYALLVLTLINLVNYLDRYIISVAMPRIQAEFGLSGTQGGMLASLFIVVFMVASPLGGFLGDRLPRKLLVGGSVLLWSLATGASGLATWRRPSSAIACGAIPVAVAAAEAVVAEAVAPQRPTSFPRRIRRSASGRSGTRRSCSPRTTRARSTRARIGCTSRAIAVRRGP